MQKLQFEPSWDRTLSAKDRERIEKVFLKTRFSDTNNLQLTSLWNAINHKGELLVTVIIHNFSSQLLSFNKKKVRYMESTEKVGEHTFNFPSLIVEPESSMPWTFIFPVENFSSHATFKNGYLEVVSQ